MKKVLSKICLFVCAVTAATNLSFASEIKKTEPVTSKSEVRLAVVNSFGVNISVRYFNGTVNAIAKAVAPRRLNIQIYDQENFLEAARNDGFDLAIASSGLTAVMLDSSGGTALLTAINKYTPDPNRANAGVIITRSDRADINSLEDLRGKTLAVSSKKAFAGFLAVFGEIEAEGINPNHLFRTVTATRQPMTDLVDRVLNKEVDVAFVASCMLENMEEKDSLPPRALKVINEKKDDNFYCKHSTRLYPGWILSAKSSLSSQTARNIVEALLQLKPDSQEGTYWTIASDFEQMNLLLQRTAIRYLDDRTVSWALNYYKNYFLIGGILLIVFILNWIYLAVTVRRKKKELQKKVEENKEYEKENRLIQARIESLEKANTIGIVSGLVAHELKQPLAAINNYAEALLRKLNNNRMPSETSLSRALKEIHTEGQRASDIIDFVRSIGKKEKRERKVFDAQQKVMTVLEMMRRIGKLYAKYSLEIEENVLIKADPLNVDLVLLNLIKNAQEALTGIPNAEIKIIVRRTERWAQIIIEDNGPKLSDEEFARLRRVGQSTKQDGLGLGLAIAQELTESNGGILKLSKIPDGGLRCTVNLPPAKENNHALN